MYYSLPVMIFEGFNWDSGNERKCQKHGLVKKYEKILEENKNR